MDEDLLGVNSEDTTRNLTESIGLTSLGNESIVAEGHAMRSTVEVSKRDKDDPNKGPELTRHARAGCVGN